MRPLLAFLLSILVLSGCASAPAARATAWTPSCQVEGTSVPQQPRLRIPAGLPGWTRSATHDDPTRVFLTHRDPIMVLRIALEPSGASPEEYVRAQAAEIAKLGRPTSPVEAAGDKFASANWTGTLGGHPKKGVIAARRTAGAPDHLIVFSGYWPAEAGRNLEDEIDLLVLLTSAE